jgi:putative acetyltransferase
LNGSHRVAIRRAELTSDAAKTLIGALNSELTATYPEPGATHFDLEPQEVVPERGGFFIAEVGDAMVGCGALRALDADTAELKRMFVMPTWRGLGLSKKILAALEGEAAHIGASRVLLETGERQVAAMALYERSGYRRMAPFGQYVDSPLSVCMEKRVGESRPRRVG